MPQDWFSANAPKTAPSGDWFAANALAASVPEEPSTLSRVGSSAWNAAKATAEGLAKVSGIPGMIRNGPVGAIQDQLEVGKSLLQAQFDQYRKAKQAEKEGHTSEMIGHAVAAAIPGAGPYAARIGEQVGSGQTPEAVGEALVNLPLMAAPLVPKALRAGKAALVERAAGNVAKVGARIEGDLLMSIPPTKTAPYTSADLQAAKPYLNAQHAESPITSTVALKEAADAAIGGIEAHAKEYAAAFPEAKLTPNVRATVAEELGSHARKDFASQGLKELESLEVDRPRSLPELEDLRQQLNAENTAVKKRNNYDQYTARQTDPGFAAREIAAREIRDQIYNYYEDRGLPGVRELRRDEGAVIKVRNAAERQIFAGQRPVAGTDPGFLRKAAAQVVKKGATAAGASVGGPVGAVAGAQVGEELGSLITGTRKTRDDLVSRAFAGTDARRPSYPQIPVRPPIAGELGPGATVTPPPADTSYVRSVPAEQAQRMIRGALPPSREPIITPTTDPSGRIPATLPTNYLEDLKLMEGPAGHGAVAAPAAERTFLLRWLSDDLKEMPFQSSSRMKGAQNLEEWSKATTAEEHNRAVYAPRVAGTPTQEMFHAMGIKGSRAEIADRLDRFMATGKGSPQIGHLADALREAWDGQRFDFDLVSDDAIAKLGIRRRDLRSPVTIPDPHDMPQMHARFFGGGE